MSGPLLTSKVNNQTYHHGNLELFALEELRRTAPPPRSRRISVREVVGDVLELHMIPENEGALFQAASQFNLLEMSSPHLTPEAGVTRYAEDHTQGPACAMACAAGTVYRNYFVDFGDEVGQTARRQIDCAAEFGMMLGNAKGEAWEMRNGYAMGKRKGLLKAGDMLRNMNKAAREVVKGTLRIGVQQATEVTIGGENIVSQAYCAAFPVAYSGVDSAVWEEPARALLEASYEATLRVAAQSLQRGGSNKVFLTLVGGGVFGNERKWILDAMEVAFTEMEWSGLDVRVVSHNNSAPDVKKMER